MVSVWSSTIGMIFPIFFLLLIYLTRFGWLLEIHLSCVDDISQVHTWFAFKLIYFWCQHTWWCCFWWQCILFQAIFIQCKNDTGKWFLYNSFLLLVYNHCTCGFLWIWQCVDIVRGTLDFLLMEDIPVSVIAYCPKYCGHRTF